MENREGMVNSPRILNLDIRIKKICQWFGSLNNTAKYTVLLISLLTLTWTPVFYGSSLNLDRSISWDDLIVVLTLFLGVAAVNRKRKVVFTSASLALMALVATLSAAVFSCEALGILSDMCMAVFFGFTAGMILHDIWTTQGVTSDTIVGSLCAYLLIGATWAFFYSLTETFIPGSFHLAVAAQGAGDSGLIHSQNYPLFIYYSFVTLCSLGYGEMVPLKPAARMLATGEVIVGQFYMAVFVARLIALYLNRDK